MAALPEVLMKKVDEYVDSLAPQIQPRITEELETFQSKTIDSLEGQIIDAFRSLFDKDGNSSGSRGLNDGVPDAYGGQSLPFADEIAKLTKSFGGLGGPGGAVDDLAEIFNLTSGGGGGGQARGFSGEGETRSRGGGDGDGMKKLFSAAFNAVHDHLDNRNDGPGGGGQGFQLDGLLGVLSNTVKDVAGNPEEKARMITPEIKELVGAKLRDQHAPIAEQFTKIALEHIKKWLRGNTSTRDLGDGVKGEFEDQVKDIVKGLGSLFGSKKSHGEGTSRSVGERAEAEGGESKGGFSKIISEKLSHGLAKVHREVRLEFRKILGQIEKQLFELLPDQFQRPLEKILGGNPFDSQLDNTVSTSRSGGDRGFGDDIKAKLLTKIRSLVRKVQETLRESILGVVNGGHRKFEKESWVFVQGIVEAKVQRYLPKVKITVPDDIGNEGVSVGAPTNNIQLGGGNQPITGTYPPPPPQQGYNPSGGQQFAPPPTQQYQQNQFPPPPTQEYQHGQQNQYPPPPTQEHQHGQQNQYPPPPQYNPQQYQSNQGQSYGYPNNQGY
ncbi:hypothetical protein QBC40DRAFT_280534 [Triangularia verruculosa]|uniref:Uncharacterized protein n=1 Tax=Triangularia verruculosa TaxID=2587418 RepID=A0AAN7AVF7_9PEZI|nr:hypothetical protein QBC40DRAFT_280534 [Triangularia verruculosa]